jgi:hypothetical protein
MSLAAFELGPTMLFASCSPTVVPPSHHTCITPSLVIVWGDDHGWFSSHHYDISPLPDHGVVGAQDVLSQDELVSDLDDTQMCRGRCPRVTSFKTGRVSLHAICRRHRKFGSLLGSLMVISVLVMFMYASVLVVKEHSLSFILPLAFRLS